jgi:hypothetical protein
MVHLPPATIDPLKNSGRANVWIFYDFTVKIRAAFPPHGPKYIASAMNGITPKLNVNARRTLEYNRDYRSASITTRYGRVPPSSAFTPASKPQFARA